MQNFPSLPVPLVSVLCCRLKMGVYILSPSVRDGALICCSWGSVFFIIPPIVPTISQILLFPAVPPCVLMHGVVSSPLQNFGALSPCCIPGGFLLAQSSCSPALPWIQALTFRTAALFQVLRSFSLLVLDLHRWQTGVLLSHQPALPALLQV